MRLHTLTTTAAYRCMRPVDCRTGYLLCTHTSIITLKFSGSRSKAYKSRHLTTRRPRTPKHRNIELISTSEPTKLLLLQGPIDRQRHPRPHFHRSKVRVDATNTNLAIVSPNLFARSYTMAGFPKTWCAIPGLSAVNGTAFLGTDQANSSPVAQTDHQSARLCHCVPYACEMRDVRWMRVYSVPALPYSIPIARTTCCVC